MKVCGVCNRIYPDAVGICPSDGQRLSAVSRSDPTAAAPTLDWDGPLPGDVVGSYRVESLLAEGGMGRIYRAEHIGLKRPVALKFLLPEHVARADLVRRFFNEARAVNAIRHPHIVDIYDFVEDVDEAGHARVYMVMELLEGEDTRHRLFREGPFSPALLVEVAAQVAETLAVAHEAGILHRDLKPDNIFLCRVGKRDDFVKLLDFGAAKAFGDRPSLNLTRPGVAIGTPEYMSPEQIRSRTLDGRVDAYGLGCVCYELLTGTVPFAAPSVAQILAKHTSEAPDPLARRRTVAPPAPAALEAVVMRCLAKEPAERYADLWAVAEALRAALAPPPVATAPHGADAPPPSDGDATVKLPAPAPATAPAEAEEPYDPDQLTDPDLGPRPVSSPSRGMRGRTLLAAALLVAAALTAAVLLLLR